MAGIIPPFTGANRQHSREYLAAGVLEVPMDTLVSTVHAATGKLGAGIITTEALATAGAGVYDFTLTHPLITASDIVLVQVANGTNSGGTPSVAAITPGAGTCDIKISNDSAATAFNGTLIISYVIIKAAPPRL